MLQQDLEVSQVIKNLYIGDAAFANDLKKMKQLRISHVLNIAEEIPEQHQNQFQNYLKINAKDQPDYNISAHWDETGQFIHNALKDQGVVFVHCVYGISRAPITVMAYLIKHHKYGLVKAKKTVLQAKSDASPRDEFYDQLKNYIINLSESQNVKKPQNQQPQEDQQSMEKQNQNINFKNLYNVSLNKDNKLNATQQKPKQKQTSATSQNNNIQNYQKQQEEEKGSKNQINENQNENENQIQIKEVQNQNQKQSSDQQESNQNTIKEIWYSCKNCRVELFKENKITHQKNDKTGKDCYSCFIQKPEWIQNLDENDQKIFCPKCKTKLGDLTISGRKCDCGVWITPAFQFQKNKIDKIQQIQMHTVSRKQ